MHPCNAAGTQLPEVLTPLRGLTQLQCCSRSVASWHTTWQLQHGAPAPGAAASSSSLAAALSALRRALRSLASSIEVLPAPEAACCPETLCRTAWSGQAGCWKVDVRTTDQGKAADRVWLCVLAVGRGSGTPEICCLGCAREKTGLCCPARAAGQGVTSDFGPCRGGHTAYRAAPAWVQQEPCSPRAA